MKPQKILGSLILAVLATGCELNGTNTTTSTSAGTNNAAVSSSSYVLKSGDTLSGALNLPSNGLIAGTDQFVLSGGKVGIGTATPATTFSVGDSLQATSYTSGYGVSRKAQINDLYTDTAAGQRSSISIYTQAAATSNSLGNDISLLVDNDIPTSQTVTYATKTGIMDNVNNSGTGAVSVLNGESIAVSNVGTATATNLTGLSSVVNNNSTGAVTNILGANIVAHHSTNNIAATAGTVTGASIVGWNWNGGTATTVYGVNVTGGNWSGVTTNVYGGNFTASNGNGAGVATNVYGLSSTIANPGTMTTAYGLYLNKTGNAPTNNYGIYQNDTSTNYLAGNLGIGNANPQAALDVNGHIGNSAAGVPVVSACGVGPTITGNDTRGYILTDGNTPTCTLTFTQAYHSTPFCSLTIIVNGQPVDQLSVGIDMVSTTALRAAISNINRVPMGISYMCMQ